MAHLLLLGLCLGSGCLLEGVSMGLALLLFVLIFLLDHYIAYWETSLASLLLEIDLRAVNGLAFLLGCSRLNSVALAHLQVLLEAYFMAGFFQTCL